MLTKKTSSVTIQRSCQFWQMTIQVILYYFDQPKNLFDPPQKGSNTFLQFLKCSAISKMHANFYLFKLTSNSRLKFSMKILKNRNFGHHWPRLCHEQLCVRVYRWDTHVILSVSANFHLKVRLFCPLMRTQSTAHFLSKRMSKAYTNIQRHSSSLAKKNCKISTI